MTAKKKPSRMIDIETLNDLKSYLKHAHPSYRDRMETQTVGECVPKEEGFKPYYISPQGDHNSFYAE